MTMIGDRFRRRAKEERDRKAQQDQEFDQTIAWLGDTLYAEIVKKISAQLLRDDAREKDQDVKLAALERGLLALTTRVQIAEANVVSLRDLLTAQTTTLTSLVTLVQRHELLLAQLTSEPALPDYVVPAILAAAARLRATTGDRDKD